MVGIVSFIFLFYSQVFLLVFLFYILLFLIVGNLILCIFVVVFFSIFSLFIFQIHLINFIFTYLESDLKIIQLTNLGFLALKIKLKLVLFNDVIRFYLQNLDTKFNFLTLNISLLSHYIIFCLGLMFFVYML